LRSDAAGAWLRRLGQQVPFLAACTLYLVTAAG
jgi:hypothetical protein